MPDPQALTIGERIAQARRALGLREMRDITHAEVAKAIGVTGAAISQWESGARPPREDLLTRLAGYLGVTPAYLRYGVTDAAAALYVAEPRPVPAMPAPDRGETGSAYLDRMEKEKAAREGGRKAKGKKGA